MAPQILSQLALKNAYFRYHTPLYYTMHKWLRHMVL